jgi:hypothetical protein
LPSGRATAAEDKNGFINEQVAGIYKTPKPNVDDGPQNKDSELQQKLVKAISSYRWAVHPVRIKVTGPRRNLGEPYYGPAYSGTAKLRGKATRENPMFYFTLNRCQGYAPTCFRSLSELPAPISIFLTLGFAASSVVDIALSYSFHNGVRARLRNLRHINIERLHESNYFALIYCV